VLVRKTKPQSVTFNWIMRWNPYRYARPSPKSLNIENVPSNLVLPLQKGLVRGYEGGQGGVKARCSSLFSVWYWQNSYIAALSRTLFRAHGNKGPRNSSWPEFAVCCVLIAERTRSSLSILAEDARTLAEKSGWMTMNSTFIDNC
jgi:hypothetical protein